MIRTATVVLCAFGTACAGPVATHITSSGNGTVEPMALAWASVPAGKGPSPAIDGTLRAAVEKALQERGFHFSDDAPAIVSAGFAERPASISLEGQAGRMVSDGKKQRLLQNCQDRMMRVRIALIDRANGENLYTGNAQESHCHAQAVDVVDRLASEAVRDIHAPGTDRVETVLAKD